MVVLFILLEKVKKRNIILKIREEVHAFIKTFKERIEINPKKKS